MRKCVASVTVREVTVTLRYYLFGSRQHGYGVQIIEFDSEGLILDHAQQKINAQLQGALRFIRALAVGRVFPYSLEEVIPEWNFA